MAALLRPVSNENVAALLKTVSADNGLLFQAPNEATGPARLQRKSSVTVACIEEATTIEQLLVAALPDKQQHIPEWVDALAGPSVCLTSMADVKRLDPQDICSLPVPPLVKGVLRDVLAVEAAKASEQQLVLQATKARAQAFLAPLRDRNMQPPLAGSKYFQDLKNYRLILTSEEILAAVRIVARRIESWCKGERIILVGILKGAFMFMSDLCRALLRPYSVYFMEASSYENARHQSDTVKVKEVAEAKFVDTQSHAPHKVVIVDELLDNGKTMQEIKQHFIQKLSATHTEQDILTVCLFSKKRERKWPEADITGIPDLPDLWLVGYGLDDRGTKRGWTELFAIPKVKIVETVEKEEVDRLLEHLDESAALTAPFVVGDVELPFGHKQKYRLSGIDVSGEHGSSLHQTTESKALQKADVQKYLEGLPTVKGKYEHDLRLAFVQVGLDLVPEDDIFSGNNRIYAEMRCRLRKHITVSAKRFGVEGPGDVCPP